MSSRQCYGRFSPRQLALRGRQLSASGLLLLLTGCGLFIPLDSLSSSDEGGDALSTTDSGARIFDVDSGSPDAAGANTQPSLKDASSAVEDPSFNRPDASGQQSNPTPADGGSEVDATPATDTPGVAPFDASAEAGIPQPADQLGKDGLLARWFLDDASEGQLSTVASDAAQQVVLSAAFDRSGPTWTERPTGRGLIWSESEQDGRFCAAIAGTPLATLDGSTSGTLEAVVDIQAGHIDYSRILHFGSATAEHAHRWFFSLGYSTTGLVSFNFRDLLPEQGWPGLWRANLADAGRVVTTLVFDSQTPAPNDRVKLYINGRRQERLSPESSHQTTVTIGERIGFELGDEQFCIGNRVDGERSPLGAVFYAAVYGTALTEGAVSRHANRLLAGDDASNPL